LPSPLALSLRERGTKKRGGKSKEIFGGIAVPEHLGFLTDHV